MTWFGWLVLVLVIGGVAALMWVMYGRKDSPTPCIGCGACVNGDECVFRRDEMERRKKAEALKAEQASQRIHRKDV